MQWNPYLMFDGKCEAAFRFYERCLGGKIVAMVPYSEFPSTEPTIPPELQKKIMHARLHVGNQVLMGGDANEQHPCDGIKGCSVAMQVGSPEEAERVYNALSENGTITMPLQETFWAVRFGMFTDRFGVPWMINVEKA